MLKAPADALGNAVYIKLIICFSNKILQIKLQSLLDIHEPLFPDSLFGHGPDLFDAIILWLVARCPAVPEAKLIHPLDAPLTLVDAKIIHHEYHIVKGILGPQLLQEDQEPVNIQRLRKDHVVLQAHLPRDCSDNGICLGVKVMEIYFGVGSLLGPGQGGE